MQAKCVYVLALSSSVLFGTAPLVQAAPQTTPLPEPITAAPPPSSSTKAAKQFSQHSSFKVPAKNNSAIYSLPKPPSGDPPIFYTTPTKNSNNE